MRIKSLIAGISLLVLSLVGGCERNYTTTINPVQPTPTPTTPTPAPTPAPTRIEFRVNGNALNTRIRYSNPLDGLTQVVTTLPYTVTISTTATTMFISLEATPFGYPLNSAFPFLSAQILVDGIVFREATASSFATDTLSISGNWRK